MIYFYHFASKNLYYAIESSKSFTPEDHLKLNWLLNGAYPVDTKTISGYFLGPLKEITSPWSSNAVEIAQTIGLNTVRRMESFLSIDNVHTPYDHLLNTIYSALDQNIFTVDRHPEPPLSISSIEEYAQREGLALSPQEINYLKKVRGQLHRDLTDSEVFSFSQINSEHCRHKTFNASCIIDGKKKPLTLFQLIKKTSRVSPNYLVSAYTDNVAFIKGPHVEQLIPQSAHKASYFSLSETDAVLSLKAETHNFPTTIEPFNGAATGSGGEIRDRMCGGKGSIPLAGTAVYMTSYPRLSSTTRKWENHFPARKWLYHSPTKILLKASDGASDYGNKFGQPLICGSIFTFEHVEKEKHIGFDKVIMLAGGVGYGLTKDAKKEPLHAGDVLVLLGGDNYRIGMGGASVSSVSTGEMISHVERNAIQRSNPEMQRRIMNVVRAWVELNQNPVLSIHDHGAGGHVNCFSEIVKNNGGQLYMDAFPVGDPTLSEKEILGNESQERIGLVVRPQQVDYVRKIAQREQAPFFEVGRVTDDSILIFKNRKTDQHPIHLSLDHLFNAPPTTTLQDVTLSNTYTEISYDPALFKEYLEQVLQLEAVACKDWLTNKVDRSVTGRVAMQQTCGPIQLPLNNVGVMTLHFTTRKGVAVAMGHATAPTLINPVTGGQLAVLKALLNIIWAPLTHGLKGISLSANWMWPAQTQGEGSRLYQTVEAVSDFSCQLNIPIPTGKDSLSMSQRYPKGITIDAPGTVMITATAEVDDVKKCVSPVLQPISGSTLIYIDFSLDGFHLGGSSFAQVVGQLGQSVPAVSNPSYITKTFSVIQQLIKEENILAGHDVSAGGLITTLLEMCFAIPEWGIQVEWTHTESQLISTAFSEKPAVVIQVEKGNEIYHKLQREGITCSLLGHVVPIRKLIWSSQTLDVDLLRKKWYSTSFLLDAQQRPKEYAMKREKHIFQQPLSYQFPSHFKGTLSDYGLDFHSRNYTGYQAAIIREKGTNGDREMAYALYLAGFEVKEIHMTDLITGQEDLTEINLVVFVGGFAYSDVLGSAKGWAGSFLFNPKAKSSLENFYNRSDTLSIGVCNGCQLMMELGLIFQHIDQTNHPKMHENGSGKFESSFITLSIPKNHCVMLPSLQNTKLGVWLAHGEGCFRLSHDLARYVVARYTYAEYPGNPNDSDFSAAAIASPDGRHLGIMPHIERSLFPWNWAYYPNRPADEITPWIEVLVNAREWIKVKKVHV